VGDEKEYEEKVPEATHTDRDIYGRKVIEEKSPWNSINFENIVNIM
jgi:hypothetical protein